MVIIEARGCYAVAQHSARGGPGGSFDRGRRPESGIRKTRGSPPNSPRNAGGGVLSIVAGRQRVGFANARVPPELAAQRGSDTGTSRAFANPLAGGLDRGSFWGVMPPLAPRGAARSPPGAGARA